jgi:hypothetical protein
VHFSEDGKTAYCNAALMQFALKAVIFWRHRDGEHQLFRALRGFDGLRRIEQGTGDLGATCMVCQYAIKQRYNDAMIPL